jgi:hypothetical protein
MQDEFLGDPDRQVGLSGADLADDQQTRAIARIVLRFWLGAARIRFSTVASTPKPALPAPIRDKGV